MCDGIKERHARNEAARNSHSTHMAVVVVISFSQCVAESPVKVFQFKKAIR